MRRIAGLIFAAMVAAVAAFGLSPASKVITAHAWTCGQTNQAGPWYVQPSVQGGNHLMFTQLRVNCLGGGWYSFTITGGDYSGYDSMVLDVRVWVCGTYQGGYGYLLKNGWGGSHDTPSFYYGDCGPQADAYGYDFNANEWYYYLPYTSGF